MLFGIHKLVKVVSCFMLYLSTVACPIVNRGAHLYKQEIAKDFQFLSLPMLAWIFSGCTGFLTQSKNLHYRMIGDSKLATYGATESVFL